MNYHRLGADVRLHLPVRTDRQAVVAQLDFAFHVAIDVQIFRSRKLSLDHDRLTDVGALSGLRSIHALTSNLLALCSPRMHRL